MKIQLASDLHLKHLEKKFPDGRIIEPVDAADVLVLAGDIHRAAKAVDFFGLTGTGPPGDGPYSIGTRSVCPRSIGPRLRKVPSGRHIEHQHRDDHLSVAVAPAGEHVAEAGFMRPVEPAL